MSVHAVLSVDDSADDVMLLELACRASMVSFRLQWVNNGDKALAYLQGSGCYADREQFPFPDLVLLDLKMPGKSGFDVIQWIRSQPLFQQLPVVIFTSSVHEEDRTRATRLGAEQYLVKPVSYVGLRRLVEVIDRELAQDHAPDLAVLHIPETAADRTRIETG